MVEDPILPKTPDECAIKKSGVDGILSINPGSFN
jgi:hypothetical protein